MPKQSPKSKSSKTARVLNLLTDPESIEGPADSAASQDAATGVKLADDQKTQTNIRDALEDALDAELSEMMAAMAAGPTKPAPAPSAQSTGAGGPAPENAVQNPEPEPAPKPMPRPMPTRTSESAAAESPALKAPPPPFDNAPLFPVKELMDTPLKSTLSELRVADEEKPNDIICFNVMQALVEDKADKYIKMFDLCSCNRCRIDVVALALSNLPAKYVVAKPRDLIPRLSVYEQRFNAAIVTQVMSACRKVYDKPHHERE